MHSEYLLDSRSFFGSKYFRVKIFVKVLILILRS